MGDFSEAVTHHNRFPLMLECCPGQWYGRASSNADAAEFLVYDGIKGLFKSNYWDLYPKTDLFSVRPVLAFFPFNHLPIYY